MQAAGLQGVGSQADVGAAPGHVGGHGDAAGLTGQSDDGGFELVLFGVEQGVLEAALGEYGADVF